MKVMPSAIKAYSTPIMMPEISVWIRSSVLYIHGPEPAVLLDWSSPTRSLVSECIGDLGVGLRLPLFGVLQDHQRRRPVVPQRAFRLREGHRHLRPSLERAGLERLDQRLRLGRLCRLDRLRDDDGIPERIQRRIDRRLVELLLVLLGEPL